MSHHERPYGSGLAYRYPLHQLIMQQADEIDLLELPTEDYIVRRRSLNANPGGNRLPSVLDRFPCVAHGVSLSLGSVEPLNQSYLRSTRRFLEENKVPIYSEHLAFHAMDKTDIKLFLCMPFVQDSVDWVVARYNAIRGALGRPFMLENVSYEFTPPNCGLSESEFIRAILDRTDATIMLDVTNVFNNATNHGYDPVEFIHSLPPDRVSQIHLAGGHYQDGQLIDSHSYPVMKEVWDLLDITLQHVDCEWMILERDEKFEPFRSILDDIHRAREIFHRHRPIEPPPLPAHPALTTDETASEPDPTDPQFANLRSYQRALVREVADADFRKQVRSDSEVALEDYPLTPDWQKRWGGRSLPSIDRLGQIYQSIERFEAQAERDYKREEWAQWAQSGA